MPGPLPYPAWCCHSHRLTPNKLVSICWFLYVSAFVHVVAVCEFPLSLIPLALEKEQQNIRDGMFITDRENLVSNVIVFL